MKISKILILYFFCFFYSHSFPKENFEEKEIFVGKCQNIPKKKIIEIISENSKIIEIEKNILTNQICLRAKKEGFTFVKIHLIDGSGSVLWKVHVKPGRKIATKKENNKKQYLPSHRKISKFDKDIKKAKILPGWKE